MSNETKGSWREAVAALLVIIFLVRVGGWLLPAVIAAVLFMVVGHEFGHYITAKWTGMKVTEYFVGFGPRLWSFRRGETEYGIKALPLGGYVKIVGMSSLEQIDDADEPRSYRAQTYPRRVLVASAGSLMHALMALVVLVFTFAVLGMPDASRVDVSSFTKWDGHAKNAAQVAGFQRGDEILSVSKGSTDKPVAISDASTFVSIVQHASGEQLRFTVRRDGATRVLIATPVDGRTITSGGEHFAAPTGPAHGYLGVALENPNTRVSPLRATTQSVSAVGSLIANATASLPKMFSPKQLSSLFHEVTNSSAAQQSAQSGNRPVSGVGAVRLAVQSAQAGPRQFLTLFATLNIFIGVLNLLPMMPLDGGLIVVATYERIRTRKGQPRYQADLNKLAPFVYAFLTLLGFLFLATMYLDIAHPISNPFR